MEQIGAKQGLLQRQEVEIESLQGLTVTREATPTARHSSELAKQLLMSKKHVIKRRASGMNIDRRVLAGVEMVRVHCRYHSAAALSLALSLSLTHTH